MNLPGAGDCQTYPWVPADAQGNSPLTGEGAGNDEKTFSIREIEVFLVE